LTSAATSKCPYPGYAGGLAIFQGALPDDAIPVLRAEFQDELAFIQHDQWGCLD
jgi:hypothetical protein